MLIVLQKFLASAYWALKKLLILPDWFLEIEFTWRKEIILSKY